MKNFFFIVLVGFCSLSFSNTNSFKIMLDEFVLARSQQVLNDTIEVSRAAWISSDSIHLTAFIDGSNQFGMMTQFIARDENVLLFSEIYENKRHGYQFSFATSRINPELVHLISMTIGAAPSEKKMGWKYRMGILKFI
jgi:hypothetical protein